MSGQWQTRLSEARQVYRSKRKKRGRWLHKFTILVSDWLRARDFAVDQITTNGEEGGRVHSEQSELAQTTKLVW